MNAYDRITGQIITLLEQGTVPWHKPWKASTGWPRNYVTHKSYRGINVLCSLAWITNHPVGSPSVKPLCLVAPSGKAKEASPVVFWKRLQIGEKDSGEAREIPLLRYYHVFNLAQCDGIKNGHPTATNGANPGAPTKPEEIVANMPQRPPIKDGFTRAFYSLREDYVGMPARERFSRNELYYAALFHELTHSTGHEAD